MKNKVLQRSRQARYAQRLLDKGLCVRCRAPRNNTTRLCRSCMDHMRTYLGRWRVEMGLVDPFRSKYVGQA